MKLLRLDLLAFGPFTGVSLDLAKGSERLHIIYGPNEAGKSSALRALCQLFFGIPTQTTDDFIHPYKDLRIGACIRDGQGELEFIRRKANVKSLRGPDDDTVIDEPILRRYLGGIDQDVFQTMFGINNATLVEGGKSIVEGGGDIGAILFAAGAGLAHLRDAQQLLDKEASDLFLPRGAKKPINQALNELADLRRAVKEHALPSSEWKTHDEELKSAQTKIAEIDRLLGDMQRQRGRLDRIHNALRSIARRKQLLPELALLADAAMLPPQFSELRRESQTQLGVAEKDADQASAIVTEANRQIEELPAADELLEQAERIENLHRRLGSHEKATTDRSGLAAAHQQFESDARIILRELGRDPELSEAESLRLTAVQRRQIQDLGNERQALARAWDDALARIEELSGRLQDIDRELSGLAVVRDAAELQRTIRGMQQQGALDDTLRTCRRDLLGLEQQAAVALRRLPLWSGTLDELEGLPVPGFETIDRFETELAGLDSDCRTHREKLADLEKESVELEQRYQQIELQQQVPTETDLMAAREKRDADWQRVRQAWQDARATTSPVPALVETFEKGVEASDQIADRLRREADQVAAKARCLADRERCEQQLANEARLLEQLTAQQHSARQQWSELWQPLGIDPLPPREMQRWTRQHEALVQQARAIRSHRERMAELETQIERNRQDLGRQLLRLGEPAADGSETLSLLLDRCQEIVERNKLAVAHRRELDNRRASLESDRLQAAAAAKNAEAKLRQWQSDWGRAMSKLGLADDASPAQASTVLERLHELFDKLRQAQSHCQRLEGIDRDGRQFQAEVQAFAEWLTPDLAHRTAEQVVTELNARLTRARTARAKLEELQRQREAASARLADAERTITECQGRLAVMCREARCQKVDDLAEAERRSTLRRELESEIKRIEEHLLGLSAGASLADFLADSESVDPDSVAGNLSQIERQISELTKQKSDLDQTIGSERRILEQMDGNSKAAVAAEQVQLVLARIGSDAERYARLRLASAILRDSIERYRERNQGPILKRASELFAELTVGSFEGLRVEFNDADKPVLVGVRRDKKTVSVHDGMSDGTRDQLYLALRVASLEAYFEKHDPIPFIVDDILINFDDERAAAALKALAQLSQRTQVLFFTHHRHLVELATATLEEEVVFVHGLEGKVATVKA